MQHELELETTASPRLIWLTEAASASSIKFPGLVAVSEGGEGTERPIRFASGGEAEGWALNPNPGRSLSGPVRRFFIRAGRSTPLCPPAAHHQRPSHPDLHRPPWLAPPLPCSTWHTMLSSQLYQQAGLSALLRANMAAQAPQSPPSFMVPAAK